MEEIDNISWCRHFWLRPMIVGLSVVLAYSVTPQPATAAGQGVAAVGQSRIGLSDITSPPLSERLAGVPDFQRSPFMAVVDARFPEENTVGEAFALLAGFVGYDFVVADRGIDPMAKTFFVSPLSELHRVFIQVPVRDALIALAGDGYTVVVDHAARTLSVDVRPAHRVMSRLAAEMR